MECRTQGCHRRASLRMRSKIKSEKKKNVKRTLNMQANQPNSLSLFPFLYPRPFFAPLCSRAPSSCLYSTSTSARFFFSCKTTPFRLFLPPRHRTHSSTPEQLCMLQAVISPHFPRRWAVSRIVHGPPFLLPDKLSSRRFWDTPLPGGLLLPPFLRLCSQVLIWSKLVFLVLKCRLSSFIPC